MIGIRQNDILKIARETGRVSVEDLARRFDVTLQTIRRDLGELVDLGHLDRVHGGAILRAGMANLGYEQRRRMHHAEKTRIARACAALIPDNASVILNLGTTTEAVARALLGHRNLTVITNNLNVANILTGNPDCEILVAGGNFRRSDGGLVGELTTQFIAQFKADVAVMGASALDLEGDLLDYDLAEVRVARTILSQSRAAFVVCDASKLTRRAPVRLASLSEVTRLITDAPLPDVLANRCRDWGTEVVLA